MVSEHHQQQPRSSPRRGGTGATSPPASHVAYRELGPKGGVPVVFLVHLAANLDNWDPRIIEPIARGHHVIAFDNRGLGASTGEVPDTVEAMADDAYTSMTSSATGPSTSSRSRSAYGRSGTCDQHPDWSAN